MTDTYMIRKMKLFDRSYVMLKNGRTLCMKRLIKTKALFNRRQRT